MFLCWVRLCVYVRKLAYRKICQSRVFYLNDRDKNRWSLLPGMCHTLANNATSPRKYLTKPGLFQLNRNTVEKCPESGLASGVYIGNSILFFALILDLKASVPTVVCTFLRIAVFVFFDTAMMQWKHSFVPVPSAAKWRLLIWAYVALAFHLQNFVDFPTKSFCLVVMKFCLLLSVLLLSKPTLGCVWQHLVHYRRLILYDYI